MDCVGQNTKYFKSENELHGGNILDRYIFFNLLSIFFLGHQISFNNYYPYYVGKFNNISFNPKNDIGVLFDIDEHTCCFFICNGVEKYYNDWNQKIFNCEWINLLKQIDNNTCMYMEEENCVILLNTTQSVFVPTCSQLGFNSLTLFTSSYISMFALS